MVLQFYGAVVSRNSLELYSIYIMYVECFHITPTKCGSQGFEQAIASPVYCKINPYQIRQDDKNPVQGCHSKA